MTSKILTLIGVLSLGMAIGCTSSTTSEQAAESANMPVVGAPSNAQLAANPDAPITNEAAPPLQNEGQPGELVMMPEGAKPPPLPEGAEPTGPTQLQTKLERLNKLRAAANQPGSHPPAKPAPIEAPENSYFIAELTDVAKETRVFRDHPQLRKVERIHDGKNQTIRVYLKNGKVVTLPGDKIESISKASSAVILNAAGVRVERGTGDKAKS